MRGTYIGFQDYLKGQTTLVNEGANCYYVQFDNLRLPLGLTHGWTPIRKSDIKIIESSSILDELAAALRRDIDEEPLYGDSHRPSTKFRENY